jgi:hypothetical protein
MSEVFRQLPEVIGSASAVHSAKRTAEVIPEERLVAKEKGAVAVRRKRFRKT